MAGIFVNVNDDIQNLRKLKEEINNVKKTLKGIDINIDLNIKEGLEEQLKSLTIQYDTLATKISETEGKIRLSTQRINDSTQKIIEAQEKLVNASKGQGSMSQGTAATVTETASVQAQAKAYDDLKAEIDAVLGSRSENIRRMVEEQNAIRLINAEMKQMEKSTVGGNYSPAQLKRLEQLNSALLTHKAALAEVRQVLNNNAKMDNAAADSMTRLSQELGRMRMAYRELTIEEQKSPFGKELLATINEVDAKLKSFDASIGNFQRNVGNYGSAFNGLNMSVQQIVRELPAASVGLNTFFLAISNNIPILVDEINRARKANAELVKTGEQGIPVWKQVATSLFSWQTALMVGISLLSVYGKDIANWIKELFNGESALNSLEKATKKLNDSFIENIGGCAELVTKLETLKSKWDEIGGSLNQQKTFIEENSGFFNELGISIKNISDAENLFTKNTSIVIQALKLKAKAAAAYQLAIEENKKSMAKAIEAEKEMANPVAWDYWNAGIDVITNLDAVIQGVDMWNPDKYTKARARGLLLESDAAKKAADSYNELYEEITKQAQNLLLEAGFVFNTNGGSTSALKDMAETLLAIQRKNEQDEINLLKDGEEKRLKQIDLNYKLELDKIRKWEKDLMEARGGRLSQEESAAISYAYTLAEDKRDVEVNKNQYEKLLEQYRGYFEQRKAIEEKYDKDREGLINAGASQESLDENEYQKTQALNNIDLYFAQREDEFQRWADTIVGISLEKLQLLLRQAEGEIEKMESSDSKNPALAQARAKVVSLRKEISKSNGKAEESPDSNANREWKELYNTLRKVERKFVEIGDSVGGVAGEVLALVGEITSSTITIINGIQTLSENATNEIKNVSDITVSSLNSLEKASVILTIIGGALKIMSSISDMFSTEADKYEIARGNYESYINILDKIINRQQELLSTLTGEAAVNASEESIELFEKQIEAAERLGKKRANVWENGMKGSVSNVTWSNMSKSARNEFKNILNESEWKMIQKKGLGGLFDLPLEQLLRLSKEAPEFWSALDSEMREYLEQIIASNEGIEEMKNSLKETLTGISFEDISSDFLESLYDVEAKAEDIFDDMSDYMRKALIKAMYVKNYEPEMEKWYDQWSKAMEDDVITDTERNSLDAMKESIINGAIAAAQNINSMFSSTSTYSQEVSSKGFNAMSQETADELNGRFTALQITGENTLNEISIVRITIQDMLRYKADELQMFSSMESIMANSYIELMGINANTGETVKCLKIIQNDISQVKENTKNL